MKFVETSFEGLWVIEPEMKSDARGFITRLFCKNEFSSINFKQEFVQENLSFSKVKGTFRGFHHQMQPYAEKKLVRCISGKIIDFVIDLRKNSPTFLKSFSLELNSEKLNMMLIPEGFAHGFQTLTDNCLMLYLHTNFYNPKYERGIRYDEPKFNICMPIPIKEISERDKNHPYLSNEFEGIIL